MKKGRSVIIQLFTFQSLIGFMMAEPGLVEGEELGGAAVVPAVMISSLAADFRQMTARHAVTVADERLAVLQIVEACPDRLGIGVFL